MAGKTLGVALNSALKVIGDPEIGTFTSTNILQQMLLEEANNFVRKMLAMHDFGWGLKHDAITVSAEITSGTVAVTNASTAVTSKDDNGVNADNFTNVTSAYWFRRSADSQSYGIASVDTTTSPDTLVLNDAYVGTTSTSAAYRIFQDSYPLSISDLGQIKIVASGDLGGSFGGIYPGRQLQIVSLDRIYANAGGDPHSNLGGVPQAVAIISVDTSDNPRLLFWPMPTEQKLVDIWYEIEYSENTTFSTTLLSGDAPAIASDAIEAHMKSKACLWDEQTAQAAAYAQEAQTYLSLLIRRENSEEIDQSFGVATYRREYSSRSPIRSSTYFDFKSAKR